MKLLKQESTGEIYVYTAELAKRSDMKPYEPAPEVKPEPTPEAPEVVAEPVDEIKQMAQAVLKKRKSK